jgi:hypothetical protein
MDLPRTCPDSLFIWAKKRAIVWQRPRVWKAKVFENRAMAISNWLQLAISQRSWYLVLGIWYLGIRLRPSACWDWVWDWDWVTPGSPLRDAWVILG